MLLIDEIDKSDIDLPSDLLNILEDGMFVIPELERLPTNLPVSITTSDGGDPVSVEGGRIQCKEFPLVILTSNSERDFSPAFLRRCLRLDIPEPSVTRLGEIVAARLSGDPNIATRAAEMIKQFATDSEKTLLATDQLLNAVFLALQQEPASAKGNEPRAGILQLRDDLRNRLLRKLK